MKPSLKHSILLATLIAAGCGGGTSSGVPTNSVTGHTDLPNASGTATTAVDNSHSTTATTTTVTVDGTPTQATVLAGDTVSQGDEVALIPTVVPFKISAAGRAPLDLEYSFNGGHTWLNTGLRVVDGHLINPNNTDAAAYIIIRANSSPGGRVDLRIVGPLNVTSNSGTDVLTVSDFLSYTFNVYQREGHIVAGLPAAVDYNIPANGATMYGKRIDLIFTGNTAPPQATGHLQIVYATGSKYQTRTLGQQVPDTIRFDDLTQDSSDRIPNAGIQKAYIIIAPN